MAATKISVCGCCRQAHLGHFCGQGRTKGGGRVGGTRPLYFWQSNENGTLPPEKKEQFFSQMPAGKMHLTTINFHFSGGQSELESIFNLPDNIHPVEISHPLKSYRQFVL